MAGRIVLFGATGYTGRLVAEALVAAGRRPLLAGRREDALRELAESLRGQSPGPAGGEPPAAGSPAAAPAADAPATEPPAAAPPADEAPRVPLEFARADVSDPASVRALLEPGDVLVSTVGPFARWGEVAVEAAIDAGVPYIDSTGEPPFIRRIFEEWGPRAAAAGAPLLTAMGYDWVPGNLAGSLAISGAGRAVRRVEIGYFLTGPGGGGQSGGTRASTAGVMFEPGFAFRGGRVITEAPGRRVLTFNVRGKRRQAVSVGSSEHFTLPRVAPELTDVEACLGWFGRYSRLMQAGGAAVGLVTRIPGLRGTLRGLVERNVSGSTGGPGAEQRDASGSYIVAIARDGDGRQLAESHLQGVNAYTFTGAFIAWAAGRALDGELNGAGALGPAEAFGLEDFEHGVAEAGIARV